MPEKTVCMVSGGIDSPVAAAMVGQEKEIIPLHFVLHPYYCEETFALSMRALRRLRKVVKFDQMVLFPWGKILQKIFTVLGEIGKRNYSCLLCRRGMFLGAAKICEETGANSITTGEAMGQKASQTLKNLGSVTSGIDYPIIRPLMAMDKEEITRKSKSLGLYMPKHAGCCNATPEKPRTESDPEEVCRFSEEIGLEELVESQSEEARIVSMRNKDFFEVFHEHLKRMVSENDQQDREDE